MKDSKESNRLGRFEFLAMNNPLRRWRWKYQEFPLFLKMLQMHEINLSGKVIMDMGCGSGFGTELIIKELKPSQVIAFDIMPEQIELAKKRGLNVDFMVGDATAMNASDSSCDAFFDFGVLHHIPLWRKTLEEAVQLPFLVELCSLKSRIKCLSGQSSNREFNKQDLKYWREDNGMMVFLGFF